MSTHWKSRKDANVTYRVEGSLGSGGQGEASRVVRESDGAVFVLKTLHLQTASADDAWKQDARLEREASVLESLSHPGVPAFIDRVEDETGQQGFIQGLVPGESIAALTARSGRIDATAFLHILRELLGLLAHLHSRNPPIVHRDISPRNVLLAPGPSGRASLIDFGAVRFSNDAAGPQVTTAGTFGTMAPEQMMGQAVPASDLYALGVTLVSLASGRAPTDLPIDSATGAIDVRSVVSLPEPIPTVLEKMTRIGLADRLNSAQSALDLLEGRTSSRASSVGDGVISRASRALRAFRKRAIWLVPTLVLVGGYISSIIPPDGQTAMLGGWFSGHGNIVGNMTATFSGDPAAITSGAHLGPLAWSGTTDYGADFVIASSHREDVRLWNVTNASQIGEVEVVGKYLRRIRHAAFSPDGHRFAFVSDERIVEAWQLDGETMKPSGSWPLSGDSDDAIVGLAVVGPGDLRVARFADDRLQVDDPASGRLMFLLSPENDRNGNPQRFSPTLTRLSPDGQRLVVIAEDTVRRYQLSDGALTDTTPLGPSASGRSLLVVDADGDTFAIVYQDSIEFWENRATSARASVRFDYGTHFEGPHELALSPDGALAGFGNDDRLRLVDTRTGALRRVYEGHDGHVESVAFSPDGRLLAASASDGIIRVWQVPP